MEQKNSQLALFESTGGRADFENISFFSQYSNRLPLFKFLIPLIGTLLLAALALPFMGALFVGGFDIVSWEGLAFLGMGVLSFGGIAALVRRISPKGIGQLARYPKTGFAIIASTIAVFVSSVAYTFGATMSIAMMASVIMGGGVGILATLAIGLIIYKFFPNLRDWFAQNLKWGFPLIALTVAAFATSFPFILGAITSVGFLASLFAVATLPQFFIALGVVALVSAVLVLFVARVLPALFYPEGKEFLAVVKSETGEKAPLLPEAKQQSVTIVGYKGEHRKKDDGKAIDRGFSVVTLNAALNSYGGLYENGKHEVGNNRSRARVLLPEYIKAIREQDGELHVISLQEVASENAEIIRQELIKQGYTHFYYPDDPNPVQDKDGGGFKGGAHKTAIGSGLFMASRQPIIAAGFHAFTNAQGIELLANKGVAGIAVRDEKNNVRIVYNTHTHASKSGVHKAFPVEAKEHKKETGVLRDEQAAETITFMDAFVEKVKGKLQEGDKLKAEVFSGDVNRDVGRESKRRGESRRHSHYKIRLIQPAPTDDKIVKGKRYLYKESGEIFSAKRGKRGQVIRQKCPIQKGEMYLSLTDAGQINLQYKTAADHKAENIIINPEDEKFHKYGEFRKEKFQVLKAVLKNTHPDGVFQDEEGYAQPDRALQSIIFNIAAEYPKTFREKGRWKEYEHYPKAEGKEQKSAEDKKATTFVKHPNQARLTDRFKSSIQMTNFVPIRHNELGGAKGVDNEKLEVEEKKHQAKVDEKQAVISDDQSSKKETPKNLQSGTDIDKSLLRDLVKDNGMTPEELQQKYGNLGGTNGKKLDVVWGRGLGEKPDAKVDKEVEQGIQYEETIVPALISCGLWGNRVHAVTDHHAVVGRECRSEPVPAKP